MSYFFGVGVLIKFKECEFVNIDFTIYFFQKPSRCSGILNNKILQRLNNNTILSRKNSIQRGFTKCGWYQIEYWHR